MEKEKKHYGNIDLLRYIFSIVIIIVHLKPFFNQNQGMHLFFNNIIGRVTVPFYFFVSGYFVGKKETSYIKKYIKSILPLYIVWSIIYIPFGIAAVMDYFPNFVAYIQNLNLSNIALLGLAIVVAPLILVVALLYSGTYYHLWYFPALLLSLFVIEKYLKRFNIKSLMIISFVLIVFGASETYFGALPNQVQNLLSYYFDFFITTRNFLFFGLFYVSFGYYFGNKKIEESRYRLAKLAICIVLLLGEFAFLQTIERLDSNIMLSCIPLTYYLFVNLIYCQIKIESKAIMYRFRELSKYYYLIHPLVIISFLKVVSIKQYSINSFLSCLIVVTLTHLVATLLIYIKKKIPNRIGNLI